MRRIRGQRIASVHQWNQERLGSAQASPGSPVTGRSAPSPSARTSASSNLPRWFQKTWESEPRGEEWLDVDATNPLHDCAPVQVFYDQQWYPTSWHANMAEMLKRLGAEELLTQVRQVSDPAELYRRMCPALRLFRESPGWEDRAFTVGPCLLAENPVAEEIEESKFLFNTEAKALLLGTGEKYLICTPSPLPTLPDLDRLTNSPGHDNPQPKALGIILMKLRTALRESGEHPSGAAALPTVDNDFRQVMKRLEDAF